MTRDDAVLAVLQRLEADNRRMKRIGFALLALLLMVLCGAAIRPQGQDGKGKEEPAIRDVLRTRRLELADAKGAVVAVLQAAEPKDEPGWLTDYHENGRRKWRAQIANNRYEGQYTAWWPNGIKSEEGTFVKGKKHGLFTTWHENGQPKAVGAWSDGLMTGIWTYWHDNGQKQSEGVCEDDHRIDAWKEWYPNGRMASTGSYKQGQADGHFQTWYDNGQRRQEYDCKAGKIVGEHHSWYPNGQPRGEGAFGTDGKETGEWKYWLENGAVDEKKSGTYENGKRVK